MPEYRVSLTPLKAITAEKRRLSILKIKELDALALKYQKVIKVMVNTCIVRIECKCIGASEA